MTLVLNSRPAVDETSTHLTLVPSIASTPAAGVTV